MLGATTLHRSRGIASAKTQRRGARRETSQFQLQCHCSRRPSNNNNNNNNNRQDVELLKKKKKKKGERSASCEETPQVQRRALGMLAALSGCVVSLDCVPHARSEEGLALEPEIQQQLQQQEEATTTTTTAATNEGEGDSPAVEVANTSSRVPRVYLDVDLDGASLGRIGIELDAIDKAPRGVGRFLELATGELSCMKAPALISGARFEYLDEISIRSSGPSKTRLKATTQRCDESSSPDPRALLEKELAAQSRSHADGTLLVSIKVKEESSKAGAAPTGKLVARNGKLEMVPDTPRGDLMPLPPSGTSFVLTTVTQQSAIDAESLSKLKELDETYLIVGSVVEGEDVLMKLKELPYNKSNEDSLFFKAGKSSGDKRALVAERGFNRPFAKIVISDSGRV